MGQPPPADRVDGRRARWEEHIAERRRYILDAAVALIESEPAGSEIHVRQIAERAGLVRTVVYRYFSDRAELNRAVQARVVAMMRAAIAPNLTLDANITEIITRTISAYVEWVAAHPNLYLVAERELGDGRPSELVSAIQDVADQLSDIFGAVAGLFGLPLGEADLATGEALAFGIVGQVRGTVDHWIRRPECIPKPRALTRLLSQWIWFQIDGQARTLGVVLDPTVPVMQFAGQLRIDAPISSEDGDA